MYRLGRFYVLVHVGSSQKMPPDKLILKNKNPVFTVRKIGEIKIKEAVDSMSGEVLISAPEMVPCCSVPQRQQTWKQGQKNKESMLVPSSSVIGLDDSNLTARIPRLNRFPKWTFSYVQTTESTFSENFGNDMHLIRGPTITYVWGCFVCGTVWKALKEIERNKPIFVPKLAEWNHPFYKITKLM